MRFDLLIVRVKLFAFRLSGSITGLASMVKRTRSSLQSTPLRIAMEKVVAQLKTGEVISYAEVAERAGHPGAARAAGSLLAQSADTLPWWRVVYGDGHLPPANPGLQAQRLAEEGVQLKGFRVVESPLGRFANRGV